jgi:tetratricopeptide (TPR) repeat protein
VADSEANGPGYQQFKKLLEDSQSSGGSGDPSLDMLLHAVPPALALLIENLSSPHWFTDEIVFLLVTPGQSYDRQALLEEVKRLPFVHPHRLGMTYHDRVREVLRCRLVHNDLDRFRAVSGRLAKGFSEKAKQSGDEEIGWEAVYHQLCYEEPIGLELFNELFCNNRHNRRLAVCNTLLAMAEELEGLGVLTPNAAARIDYYKALYALDLNKWDDAERLFRELSPRKYMDSMLSKLELYHGIALEKKGAWDEAQNIYTSSIELLEGSNEYKNLLARLHHRLAHTYINQGNLKKAEEHAWESLSINRESEDFKGQSLNLRLIADIYGRLRDLDRAQAALQESLSILDQQEAPAFDRAPILFDLANLYLSFDKFQEAEINLKNALAIKIESGDKYGLAFIYSSLAKVCVYRNDNDGAMKYLEASLQLFSQFRDSLNMAKVLRNIAHIQERLHQIENALQSLKKAAALLPDGNLKETYSAELRRLE